MSHRFVLLLLLYLTVVACDDVRTPVGPNDSPTSNTSQRSIQGLPPYQLPPGAETRWDAPWWGMSDAQLADSIAAHDGRVFIGFKEPTATAGVDDWGRVLVSPSTVAAAKAYLRSLGLNFEREYSLTPTVVTRIPRALVAVLRANPIIDYVEPVTLVQFEAQDTTWNIRRVGGPSAWQSSIGSGVKLLIIDTGVPNSHPDLSPAQIHACDGSDGLDQAGHGTHVAGIAAAVNNAVHVVGVAHGVALWSVRIGFTADDAKCGIEFGRLNSTFAINMSFNVTASAALTDEIKGAYADGLFMAKSAGNTNGGPVTYPGTLYETVAVTATDINNNRGLFAAIGPKVELAAPGVDVVSTTLPSGTECPSQGLTGPCSGTSMAAPHVAAAAAILKAFNPFWTNEQIRTRLSQAAIDLGVPGKDLSYGNGLLDIRGALDGLAPPSATIAGNDIVEAHHECRWDASASGGSPPYTDYNWYIDGNWQASGESIYYRNDGSNFSLELRITDSGGRTGTDALSVTVTHGWGTCPGM